MSTPQPTTDTGQADRLLRIWASAFVSGYVSAALRGATRGGMPENQLPDVMHGAEHTARHSVAHVMGDPVTRHQVLEKLEAVFAGHHVPGGPELLHPHSDCERSSE